MIDMRNRKFSILVAVCLLMAISVAGITRSFRASIALLLYNQAKYGSAKDSVFGVISRCERAFGLYPYNYYFCILAGEKAYYGSLDKRGMEKMTLTGSAEYWCETGLRLNFYKSQLRSLKTKMLETESIREAVRFWEDFVEWQFWEPFNHAVLVDLYCKSGDLEKAAESLAWVKGSRHYDDAAQKLQNAWKNESAPPPPGD